MTRLPCRLHVELRCWLIFIACLAGGAAGCTNDQPDDPAKKPLVGSPDAPQLEGGIASADAAGDMIIPEAGVQNLVSFLATLEIRQQRPRDQEEFQQIQRARAEASRRLLAEETDPQLRYQAIRTRTDALLKLFALQDEAAGVEVQQFAQSIADDAEDEVAQVGGLTLLMLKLRQVLADPNVDDQPLLDDMQALIAKHPGSLSLAQELNTVLQTLQGAKRRDISVKGLHILADGLAASEDEQLRQFSQEMRERIKIADLQFDITMNNVRDRQPGSHDKFLETLGRMTQEDMISQSVYRELINSLRWLERLHRYELAEQGNLVLAQQLANASDQELRQQSATDTTMAGRRLGLVGKRFQLSGDTRDGSPLNWSDYAGKLVLVCFWSPNSIESVNALQQIAAFASNYRTRGLELVAVSVDPNPQAMDAIFAGQKPPFPVVVDERPGDTQLLNQLANQFGIQQVPYLVLIDQRGVVRDINLHLAEMKAKVDELLQQR